MATATNLQNVIMQPAMQSAGATYTDAKTGTKLTPYTQGNQSGTVLAGSVFDPNSSNYNAKIANSGGKINMLNESNYDNNGNFIGYNSAAPGYGGTPSGSSGSSAGNNSGGSASGGSTSSAPAIQAAVQTYAPSDNSTKISQMYDQQLAAAQAALKASILQSMSGYQQTINNAPGQFYDSKNQASAAGEKNLQNLKEMLANNGQQGGVNRTEETQVNAATQNNLNVINMAQQKVISDAQAQINDLQAQGDIKGAQLVADYAAQKLQALINESNRVQSRNDTLAQQAIQNAMSAAQLTGIYNGQDTLAAKQLQNTIANDKFNQGISTAGLTGIYNGQQTMAGKANDANVADTQARTVYQNLVNQNYPAEQALKMAQAQASLTGTNLQNDYQSLVNAGYPATQAADLAYKAAQTANINRSTSLMGFKASSGGGGSSSGGNNSSLSSISKSSGVPSKYIQLGAQVTNALANNNRDPHATAQELYSIQDNLANDNSNYANDVRKMIQTELVSVAGLQSARR